MQEQQEHLGCPKLSDLGPFVLLVLLKSNRSCVLPRLQAKQEELRKSVEKQLDCDLSRWMKAVHSRCLWGISPRWQGEWYLGGKGAKGGEKLSWLNVPSVPLAYMFTGFHSICLQTHLHYSDCCLGFLSLKHAHIERQEDPKDSILSLLRSKLCLGLWKMPILFAILFSRQCSFYCWNRELTGNMYIFDELFSDLWSTYYVADKVIK